MNYLGDRPRRASRAARGLMALVAAALLGVACGGGSDEGVATLGRDSAGSEGSPGTVGAATGDSDKSFDDALLDYTRCMRDEGIEMPDPETDGEGGTVFIGGPANSGDEEEFTAADEKCRHFLPDVGEQLSPEQEAEMQDQILKFAQCMREHGIDVPDPQGPEGGAIEIGGDGLDINDPDFQAAQEACEKFMPGGGPGQGVAPGGGA